VVAQDEVYTWQTQSTCNSDWGVELRDTFPGLFLLGGVYGRVLSFVLQVRLQGLRSFLISISVLAW
jgi:hypothetical protein